MMPVLHEYASKLVQVAHVGVAARATSFCQGIA